MAQVRMYCTRYCPYWIMALRLLDKKGHETEKIYVDNDPSMRKKMEQDPSKPSYILNMRGVGYVFASNAPVPKVD